jgi:pSer/pThr/pTyr-binding forkhead associated (FHA) protein
MYQLTVRSPDGSEQIYILGDDQGLIVGRDEGSDILLPSSRVSRRHARFFVTRGVLHLEDLGSQGGVFVGGARVNGTAELRPGPQIEIGEFKIRVKREEATAAPEYLGTLIGAGAMKGRTLTLPAVKAVIGREEPADILIPDDSVSRRHAEIRRMPDGSYVVRDLHSSNGTLVNNVKLAPDADRPLRPSDKIAFGDTQWEVASTVTGVSADVQRSRTRALLFLTLVSLLVIAAVGWVYVNITSPTTRVQHEVTTSPELRETCEAEFAANRFDKAVNACQSAYEQDPIDTDLRMKVRTAEHEAKAAGILESGKNRANVDEPGALEILYAIPLNSYYFPSALPEVQKIAERLTKKDLAACRSAAKRKETKVILESCARYLDITCHNGVDQDVLKTLRAAESDRKPWSCPARLAVWYKNGGQVKVENQIPKMYPDKDIADAVMAYRDGNLGAANRALSKSKASKESVAALREDMNAVDAKFREAMPLLNQGRVRDGEEMFAPMFPRDEHIMPPNVESYYNKTIRDALASGYYKAALPFLDKEQFESAYKSCASGAKYRPGDAHLLDCLDKSGPKLAAEIARGGCSDTAKNLASIALDGSKLKDVIKKACEPE